MANSSKKVLWWIVGIVVIVIVIVTVTKQSTNNQNGPIEIGFVGPLTGGAASYGESAANGIRLAVNDINQAGGINGKQVQVIYEDGKCTGQDAASAAQKLVSINRVQYLIVGCSGESFGILPIIEAAKVFAISPISSAAKLSATTPYFMRNVPNDNVFGPALADYLASSSYKNVATIAEQTDYAQGIKTNFLAELQKDGLSSAITEDYTSDTTDFRSILLQIKSAKPDVIFIDAQSGPNLVHIAEQARQIGIQTPFVSIYLGQDPAITAAGTLLNGAVFADLPGLNTPKGQEILSTYQTTYGSAAPYPFFVGSAYDDVYLITQAISSVGQDPTKVEQYLHTLMNYNGTIGTYSFNQDGDITGFQALFQKIVNGKLTDVK